MKANLAGCIIISLFLLFSAGSVQSEVLTLGNCIDLALENRASIISVRGNEELSKANRRTALGAFLPRLDASYGYSETRSRDGMFETQIPTGEFLFVIDTTFVDGLTGESITREIIAQGYQGMEIVEQDQKDQDRTSKSLRLDASISVFNLSSWFDLAASGAERTKAHLDVIASEQDLVLSVKVSYYAYLAMVENVTVQQDAVKRSEEQLKLIQSRYDLGSAALSDVLKQKVQFGNDRLSLLSAQNAATTAKADLAYTIGIDPNRETDFVTDYTPREFVGSMEDALKFGLKRHPGLLASEKKTDAARHHLRSAKAGYLPTVSAYAGLNWYDGTQGDTVIYNSSSRSMTGGFQVSFNIFDGFLREKRVSSAKVNRNNALAQLTESRNRVTVDIKKAYLDIEKTRQQRIVAEENVEAATEDLKISKEKYNLGAATILDLLTAQESLKSAQVSLISVGFDLNLAVARLENAMGKFL